VLGTFCLYVVLIGSVVVEGTVNGQWSLPWVNLKEPLNGAKPVYDGSAVQPARSPLFGTAHACAKQGTRDKASA